MGGEEQSLLSGGVRVGVEDGRYSCKPYQSIYVSPGAGELHQEQVAGDG